MMNFITDFDLGQMVRVTPEDSRRRSPFIGVVVGIDVCGTAAEPLVLYRVQHGQQLSHNIPRSRLTAVASYPPDALMVGDRVKISAAVQKGPYPLRPDTVRIVRDVSRLYVVAEAETGYTMGMPQAFDKETCTFSMVQRAADSMF